MKRHTNRKTLNHRSGKVTYFLYSKEEADNNGIEYKSWKDASIGDYVLSDDGYVAKAFFVKEYKHKKAMSRFVKTAFGMAFYIPSRDSGKLKLLNNEVGYTISGKKKLFGERKEKLRMIAMNYAITSDLETSIRRVTDTYTSMNRYNWRTWTKTEEFKTMVREELTKLLAAKGFSEAETLELLGETVDIARGKGDAKTLAGVVNTLLKMHGIDQPAKIKHTEQLEANTIENLIGLADNTEKEIEFKAKKINETEGYKDG